VKRPRGASAAVGRVAAAGAVVGALAVLALFVAPDPLATRTGGALAVLAPPSWEHWLGTDDVGRDVFARLVHGARTSLGLGVIVVALATTAGAGAAVVVAGRPRARQLLAAIANTVAAVPPLLLALTVMGVAGPSSLTTLVVALALPRATEIARVADGAIARALQKPHAEAARALGATPLGVLWRHALPLAAPEIAVLAAATLSGTVLAEAALGFVGAGVRPPTPSWGELLAQAHRNHLAWWLALPAAGAVTTVALLANALADAVGRARR
jgi:peptide/nickel transport system permease protein